MRSDSKIESAAGEALLRTSLSLNALITALSFALGFALNLLTALLLEVSAFHLLKLSCEAFDLVLVLIDLGLVHVEFSCHSFHLRCFLFEILLVDRQLLCNLRAGLSSKKVLELNVQLLFLLNDDIFLNNLFSLLNKTLLKRLNLLEHFPSIGVCAFKLSPSVVVKRVFEFFRKCLN